MPDDMQGFEKIGPVGTQMGGFERTKPQGEAPQSDQPSVLGSMFRGFLQGAGDLLYGGAQIGARMGEAPQIGQTAPEMPGGAARVDAAAQQRAQAYAADPRVQAHPLASGIGRIGGNIAATAPLAAIPGGGATIPGRIAAGAAAGALGAATQPVEGDDFWSEKARQIGSGAVAGGALGAAGSAIVGAAGAGLASLPPQVQRIAAAYPIIGRLVSGVEGRTLENFDRAAVDQALAPIGVTAPKNMKAGSSLINFAGDKYSGAYNTLLPKLSLARDTQLEQDLDALRKGATDLADDEMAQFNRQLNNRFGENNRLLQNGLNGKQIKDTESDLRRLADRARKQNNPGLAEALTDAREVFLDAVERQNPAQAKELKNLNTGFALFARIEGAAASAGRRGDEIFSPQDLRNASFRSDKSARHGNFARGADLMQGIANAGDFALNHGSWNQGTISRIVMPIVGATLGGGIEPGAIGGGIGAAVGAGLPHAVSAVRSLPGVAPAARGIAGAAQRFAPGAGAGAARATSAQRMKAARKVGDIQSDIYKAKRSGDLATVQRLQGQLADANAEYRKLVGPDATYLAGRGLGR